ncbi:MAG: HAMP domain-containing histidine kinase [Eubacterium sp.]|nr:HAMP domain-containing histidine kinase [Eubacterium sp.]
MKIFVKLYIGMMAVIIVSLLITGYLTIGSFLNHTKEREIKNCLDRYSIFMCVFKNKLETATKEQIADPVLVKKVADETVIDGRPMVAIEMNGKEVYNSINPDIEYDNASGKGTGYEICKIDGSTYVVCYSIYKKDNVVYKCTSADDVTEFINDVNAQRRWYVVIFLCVLLGGTIFAVLFSNHLTKPIRHMSEASKEIADGNYGFKIDVTSNDELGELAHTFNYMSEMIREKIDALELSVKQKEDFIAAFAHETKSPMTSVIGYADYIYQMRLDDEERKEAASAIMNEGMRLLALSEKLMDIVSLKQSGLKKEEIQTNEMIEDVRLSINPKIEKREAVIDCNVEDEYIFVDYDLFKTVVINVIDNALKAGAKQIKIKGNKAGSSAYVLAIEDNGIGISENELSRVKEAFYMVDKSRSRKEHGAGLGLALCNRIMNFHGGNLDIKSKLGIGTTVILKLPLRVTA